MSYFINRFFDWMTVEPTIGLLMVVTAIVLFTTALRRNQERSNSIWPWVRRIVESSVSALLFIGLLWAFRSILNTNNTNFNSTHGSQSDASLSSAQTIWGRPHVQRELSVAHFVWRTEKQEIPRAKPDDPIQYKDVPVRYPVPENSIVGFNGTMNMELSEREKGYALYSGFIVDADLNYDILNDSTDKTDVEWVFPLAPGQRLFENFKITLDDQDISSLLRFGNDLVQWQNQMEPHQQSKLHITYKSRGMNYLYYQVPVQRQINNFTFTLTADRLPTTLLNYPEGVLTPTEIKPTSDGQGSILNWKLDHAITMAGMGVSLPQPAQPGAQVLRILYNSPFALTMLIAMIALTLLLLGQPVNFLDLALLSGIYCVQFLIMAGISDYVGFWGAVIIGGVLTMALAYITLRRQPLPLARRLILGLLAFFAVIYPLSGLLTEATQANSFDLLVKVGLVVYAVVLALYRMRISATPPTAVSGTAQEAEVAA